MDRRAGRRLSTASSPSCAACEDLGRRLDVRENIKFRGGAFTRWVHETFPETGCSLAIEFKKFFMDEWTGELNVALHQGVYRALQRVAAAVCEELSTLGARPTR